MSMGTHGLCLARRSVLVPAVLLVAAASASLVLAQGTTTTTTAIVPQINIVGGVSIDAAGMLTNVVRDASGRLREARREALQPVPPGMNRAAGLRKISLRLLEAEIQRCADAGKPLPEAVSLMAGLLQIRYVFVDREHHDIILAGPAEGWVFDRRGYFVGAKSGRPVMLLDDLLVALRAAVNSPSVLSCSINPTPEGIRRVQALTRQSRGGVDARTAATAIAEQLGPQRITIHGVPGSSHFARVMVAADYRMKRISMGLERAPIRGLPSYTELVKSGSGMHNMLPRWWLQPDYQPLLRDEGGLAWELRGAAVRCMTENDFLDANGVARPSGRSDPLTRRWADLMTDRYSDLSLADPVFAQLQNCMDLAVVSALLVKGRLAAKAGQQFPILTGAVPTLPAVKLDAPKQVATSASLARKGKKTMIAAGGVQINPWTMMDKAEKTASLAQVQQKLSAARGTRWWWD